MKTFGLGMGLLLLSGCSGLIPKPSAQPTFHSLDRPAPASPAPASTVARTAPLPLASAPTMIVNPPHAAAGYDSRHIIYFRKPYKLEHFAHHEWIDTPTRMLAPLIVAAIEHSGAFRAAVLTPSAAVGEMTLDTEILRLSQDFSVQPSRVRFTLHASIVDSSTRVVLGWREFDASLAAPTDDPDGGVVAANSAVQAVLDQLVTFCVEAAKK